LISHGILLHSCNTTVRIIWIIDLITNKITRQRYRGVECYQTVFQKQIYLQKYLPEDTASGSPKGRDCTLPVWQ